MKINGFILFTVALILGVVLLPTLFIASLFMQSWRDLNAYLLRNAISIDQHGNSVGGPVFNALLINSKEYHRFGSPDDTISYVMTINKHHNNLTKVGKILDAILNFIDPGHTDMATQRALKAKKWIPTPKVK